ncbi:23911_t:CDS:2, partial [Gigaspora margarita]
KNYKMLQQVMKLLISELHSLVVNGLEDSSRTKWKVQFYFSSDWKFMAIILGIEKDMNQLKDEFFNNSTLTLLSKHTKPPLLSMIPLNYYVFNELCIMLQIWDRLWKLVIQELKSKNRYNTHTRAIISMEMKEFHMQSWSYTPLIGGNKEKVLCDFNFDFIFSEERAILITRL